MPQETIFYSDKAPSFLSANWQIILAVIVIVLFILAVIGFAWLKRRLSRPELYGMSREQVQKQWQKIQDISQQSGDMGQKLAIIEADKLLDGALKSLIMPGDTLGERLKVACYKYPKLKNVWWAHKLRNNLVHDHDFHLRGGEARRALVEFEKALRELKVL
ncbi:hypothetical protein KKG46_01665 [Patescibacteria group bacterium]|nr:hypothetical protein [Patescibacteria group bacterium]